jgi:hypothetical protein
MGMVWRKYVSGLKFFRCDNWRYVSDSKHYIEFNVKTYAVNYREDKTPTLEDDVRDGNPDYYPLAFEDFKKDMKCIQTPIDYFNVKNAIKTGIVPK